MVWLLKLLHPLVLEIKAGKVSAAKGRFPSRALREIQQVISEAGVGRGSIHADGAGRFHFSGEIPADCHQRLRNTLTSL
jgi:hypothetical protein